MKKRNVTNRDKNYYPCHECKTGLVCKAGALLQKRELAISSFHFWNKDCEEEDEKVRESDPQEFLSTQTTMLG